MSKTGGHDEKLKSLAQLVPFVGSCYLHSQKKNEIAA